MLITKPGYDIITVTENDYNNIVSKEKVHLVRIDYDNPTDEKIDWVLNSYKLTNRFVIKDNIRFYNDYFKKNNKKYYVENGYNAGIFSFFKKNNKILLNVNILRNDIKNFILKNYIFRDILKNLEIIQINDEIFNDKSKILSEWNGNVIIEKTY